MTNRGRSQALYRRACELMPGGVSSPVRAFQKVGGTPVYFDHASGSRFWDADGHEYIDFCMSFGPLILGHAHALVIEAVSKAARDGLSFGACCKKEIELAERILQGFASMQQVRFVSSGTEAVMTAIRLARGVTGRSKILKFAGGYHGHSDSLLVNAGSGLATLGTSSSKGVPEAFAAETFVLPFDDLAALEETFARVGQQIAAAIVEPLPANEGLLEQKPAWLKKLRELTLRHGALLIFDEVISGFRLRYGGYGDSISVSADLITLGKIIGGGMPAAAVCGSRAIMENLAPEGGVYQAGTLAGNPVSLAAGIATLQALSDGRAYRELERLGATLDEALARRREGLPALRSRRVGSIVWFHLAEGEVPRRAADIRKEAVARFNAIHPRLLNRGIYLPPSAYEVLFVSAAHTAGDLDRLAEAITCELRELP